MDTVKRGLSFGAPAAETYPIETIVSYLDTPEGTVTAIFRHWPKQDAWDNSYHDRICPCKERGGYCLIQVLGRIEPEDAPLYRTDYSRG